MRPSGLTLARRELTLRWVTAMMACGIVAAAVAIVILGEQVAVASEAATRRIQRDIGLNLVILPAQTNLDAWWIDRIPSGSMPEEWIDRLEQQDVANRLVPLLVARVQVGASELLLTGIEEERFKRGNTMKPVFGKTIQEDTIVLGALAARSAGVSAGDTLEVKGRPFTVSRVLEPGGSEDDVRAWVGLAQAQSLLGMGGRINEIRALECHCSEDVADPLAAIKAELEPIVPGARIVRMTALADARRSQRQLAERIIQNAIPPTIILAAVIVAMLASVNVRERRNEIGVLCAHGYGKGTIAGMILTRAILIGLIGAALGWIAGTFSGAEVADRIIGHGPGIPLDATLLVAALVLTPALTALVSLAPAIVAASSDPARLMRAP